MLFNEIYGAYYKAAGEIIKAALDNSDGSLDDEKIRDIAAHCGTRETPVEIEQELKSGKWVFLDGVKTNISHKPERPWTDLELRWLKTIMLDPRVRLFMDEPEIKEKIFGGHTDLEEQLSGIEPLYLPEDIVYFDRYQDGDPYDDPDYIGHFHMVLKALHRKRKLNIQFKNRGGSPRHLEGVIPLYIEYSDRDDKFRLYGIAEGMVYIINIARITSVSLADGFYTPAESIMQDVRKTDVEFLVKADTGTNALERVMMQFCHYRKRVTEEEPDKSYKVHMEIDETDKTDVVIQLLSFGPDAQLLSPDDMVDDIKRRIRRQAMLFLQ